MYLSQTAASVGMQGHSCSRPLLKIFVFMHGCGCTIACFLECIYDDESASSFWQTIFSPTTNVVSEAYANPGHNQASESYFGSLKHQANNSPSLLTSDLDSQSKQHANSLMKAPVYGNMPNDVPARQNSLGLWKYLDDDISLGNNPSSGILPTEQVTDERPFHITEISSEWAYCTEDTKVPPPLILY